MVVVPVALSFQEVHTTKGHHSNWIRPKLLDLRDVLFSEDCVETIMVERAKVCVVAVYASMRGVYRC